MGGLGLTPEQTILNRNIAISQAQLRQNLISSQIATNRAVQQARFNANNLMAQARANIGNLVIFLKPVTRINTFILAAANANALMIGK
jgi:hypothetical protein